MATKVKNDTKTGISLAELLGGDRHIDAEIRAYAEDGEKYETLGHLPITYDPKRVTPRMTSQAVGVDMLPAAVCRVVTGWELADDGGAIPVGTEHIVEVGERVPTVILNSVLLAIIEDQQLNPRRPAR